VNSAGADVFPLFLALRDQADRFWVDEWVTPLSMMGRVIGTRARSNEVSAVSRFAIASLAVPPQGRPASKTLVALELAAGLDEGLRPGGRAFRECLASNDLSLLVYWAKASSGSMRVRDYHLPAIKVLALAEYIEVRTNLFELTSTNETSLEARKLAFATLTRFPDRDCVPDMLRHWRQLAQEVREEAAAFLARRPDRVLALLDAVEKGSVPPADFPIAQQAQLRSHRDAALRERAQKLFGRVPTGARQSVVETFQPALALKGDVANGRKLFQARCATCHKLGGEGHALGPDLATVKSGGKEKLLIAILDPNREVAPNFASYSVETKDGESLSGILASESAASVTLRMAGGAESVMARANIASLQSQGRSLMPEGLEEGLKPQDLADLMEFVLQP
jgi:putative heme-binding domain-containing protein